jgi:hypothetical protein
MTAHSFGGTFARFDRGAAATVTAGLVAAAAAAYLLLYGSLTVALAFSALPLVAWLFAKPQIGVVLLGGSIPILYDLTGGRGGFHLAFSDLLLMLVGANLLVAALLTDASGALQALRPLRGGLIQYGVFLVLLLLIHLSFKEFAQTGQRLELFFLPLVIGAFATIAGRELAVLKAYVVAAACLAVLWPFDPSLGQKNPVGQLIGNAILLLVGVRGLRAYAPLALILVPGLLLTGSRGAVLATAIGLIVLITLQWSRTRTTFTRVVVVALVAFVAYAMLPVSLQNRLTTLMPGTGSRAAYALQIRQQYLSDAEHLIAAHPVVGVGVGNYLTGGTHGIRAATDPHNILLLQAAEGGYLFAVSFLVLVLVAMRVLRSLRDVDIAPVAAAVFLATVLHGFVAVYWVRGTPGLAWLLVGMACAGVAQVKTNIHAHAG